MDDHLTSERAAVPESDAHRTPCEAMDRKPLFLIDGNNLAYRAFFALPDTISTSEGFPTNALYGFCSMMIKILVEFDPSAVIVAWDSREKTFRHKEFAEYKAQRKPMPELLRDQWPYLYELAEALGFVNLSVPGYEADDILGTLARQGDAEGRRVVIVTGDRDALQLVTDRVSVMANTKGVSEVRVYDPGGVSDRCGVPPLLIPDLLGLKGDTSDNIPGVPGIGEKTAAQLLQEFGSLEGVLASIDQVKGPKRRELLAEHADIARMSKTLALIDREVPVDMHVAEMRRQAPDRQRLLTLFRRFEFTSLLDRLPATVLEEAPDADSGGPEAASPSLRTSPVLPIGLEAAVDWTQPVGVSSGARAGEPTGTSRVWFAQRSTVETGAAAGSFARRLDDPEDLAGIVRGLLARGRPACHDLKGDRLLAMLLDQAGHDTMVGAYLLSPGKRSYGLDDLLADAGLAPAPEGPDRGAAEALAVLDLAGRQEGELRELGMWELFQGVELPLTRVLIDMENAGIHLDCYRLGEITAKVEDQLDGLEDEIYREAGEEFNLGSPQQLAGILFDRLGLPRGRKIKTGYSTDARTLEGLRGKHPIIGLIETYRELTKLLSTYLLTLPSAVDATTGRLHTTFHQTVAATGRLSSSDPNLQNIPIRTDLGTRIRGCFTAEADNVLVVADYSQIELRIMAHISREPALLEPFRRGEDIHARTAAEVFGGDTQIPEHTRRRWAKAVNFGIMYGISPFGLAQQLGVAREEAAAYIARYFERLPLVRAFIDATIIDATRQGFVSTLMGRRRPIPELRSGDHQTKQLGERLAVNSIIQGTAADIIKVAMIRCHTRLACEFPDARLVLQVHDELIIECRRDEAHDVSRIAVDEMVAAFEMDPPLVVDVGVGEDWLSAK